MRKPRKPPMFMHSWIILAGTRELPVTDPVSRTWQGSILPNAISQLTTIARKIGIERCLRCPYQAIRS